MQQEAERIRQETAQQIARLDAKAAQEIEAAGKTARRDLKEYAAKLALELAEQRIRNGADAGDQRRRWWTHSSPTLGHRESRKLNDFRGRRTATQKAAGRCGGRSADNLDAAQKFLGQLRAVQDLIDSSACSLRNALASPAVPPARKRAVLGERWSR